jgi:hypothetical protein
MAPTAVPPVRVVVRRVAQVAATATGRRPERSITGDLSHGRAMTSDTLEPAMTAAQRELGLPVVVEDPPIPAIRVVALRALRAEASVVNVRSDVARHAGSLGLSEAFAGVAILTRDQLVKCKQREPGEIVVEARALRETRLAVTSFALGSQRPLVNVYVSVAIHAARRRRRSLRARLQVTEFARERSVCAAQRVLGGCVVLEARTRPGARSVAPLAIGAVSAVVIVIQPMTAHAARRERDTLWIRLVALLTAERGVSSMQREARVTRVVEAGLLPAGHRMARRAVVAQPTAMSVLASVTGDALGGGLAEVIQRMTRRAGNLAVTRFESKAGRGVIEVHVAPPNRGVT